MSGDRLFGEVNLKLGPYRTEPYIVGEPVPIDDGVYVGWEGLVVVKDGRLSCVFPGVVSKFGDKMTATDLMKYFGLHTVTMKQKEKERREADGKKGVTGS